MSIKLRDLIKQVRSCKTAAEERAIITKESALIRTAFKSEDYPEYRHRNVAKMLYIHMLGYPTHFGQMETVKMIASPRFPDKRIGYLAMSMLLDERQEVLTLVTNSLQQDLHSSNPFVVGLALTALGNIGGAEIARDLAADVDKHLQHSNPYIRKKAALTTIRMLRKVPDLVDQFLPRIVVLLTDKNHNVLLGGVSLVSAVLELSPGLAPKFTRLVPALVKILRKLITAGYAPEYDVGGVTDPFLQARILGLLRQLGRGNESASEAMGSVLAQVASANTEGASPARNAGNAVLYEAVATIMGVESESGLRVLGVNILGRFLGSRDPNMKYVALETLRGVVALDPASVQRHRGVIVECLRDPDASIRRRALELGVALVSPDNVRGLMGEMLGYLATHCDAESRPDVCARLAAVADKHAPSRAWHVHTLLALLATAGNSAKREVLSHTLFLISHAEGDVAHAALAHSLYCHALAALAAADAGGPGSEAQQPLLQAAVWVVGEYAHLLLTPPAAAAGDAADGAAAMPTTAHLPAPAARTGIEVVRTLGRILRLSFAAPETRAMVLTALLKATHRLARDAPAVSAARALLGELSGSADVELQTRSVEYGVLASPAPLPGVTEAEARSSLLAPMPLLEEAVLRARAGAATGAATDAKALAGDDVAMEVMARTHERAAPAPAPAATAAASAASGGGGNLLDLDSLFGSVSASAGEGLGSAHTPTAAAAPASGLGGMADLFGAPMPAPAAAPRPAAPAPAPATGMSALDDLFGASMSLGAPAPAPAPAPRLVAPAPAPLGGGGGMGALDDLFGAPSRPAAPAPAPAPPALGGMGGIGDLFAPAPQPAPVAAAPAASAASAFGGFASAPAPAGPGFSLPHSLVAYENPSLGLRIVMTCDKPGVTSPLTDITASFTVSPGHRALHGFVCQAAVPKFARVVLHPATGTSLVPGAPAVTQLIKVENTAQGTKPLALKLKLLYTPEGALEQVTEVTDVRNFPPTL